MLPPESSSTLPTVTVVSGRPFVVFSLVNPRPQQSAHPAIVEVVVALVVVVVPPTVGSGTLLPSPPMAVPPAAVHSLGFCGSQSSGPPGVAGGRQQLMSWGGLWSGVQPWSTASHQLAKVLSQALPP